MKVSTWVINDDVFSIAEERLLEVIREVEVEYQIFQDTWGDYIYDQLFARYEKSGHPASYVVVQSIAGMRRYVFNTDWSSSPHHFVMGFSETRLLPIDVPPQVAPLMDVERWLLCRELVLHDHPVWAKMKSELLAINAAYEKAAAFFKSFMNFLGDLIEQYPTVNEVMAVWPPFRYLLPKEYRDEEFPFEGDPKPLPTGHNVAKFTAFLVRSHLRGE